MVGPWYAAGVMSRQIANGLAVLLVIASCIKYLWGL